MNEQLADETLFPAEEEARYPRDFLKRVRPIFKRLFRVYAHIYHCHVRLVNENGLAKKLEFSTCHFIGFMKKYKLCDEDDLSPLKEILDLK